MKIINEMNAYWHMYDRLSKGLDPLTGEPLETVGKIENIGGKCYDSTGREVTLDNGRWIYV